MIEELRKRISEATLFMRGLIDTAEKADRGLTDEEKATYETKQTELNGLQERLKLAEETNALPMFDAPASDPVVPTPEPTGAPAATEQRRVWDRETRAFQVRDRREDEPYNTFGEYMQDVMRAGASGGANVPTKLRSLEVRAPSGMSTLVESDGGFAVQTDFQSEILRRVYEMGQVMQRVKFIPISKNSNGIKINALAETSRVAGSRLGGVQVYWPGESGSPTAKKPSLRQLTLSLNKVVGLLYTTEELEADAAALAATSMDAFSEELTFATEEAFWGGDGNGKPQGFVNSACAVSVAKESGQAAATIVYENVAKMWARCFARNRLNSAWFINQDIEPQLLTLGITVGVGGAPVYQPPGGASETPYATLFGRPIIPVEYAATLGTVQDIVLADFGAYVAIDKGAPSSASSIHVRFVQGENTFRIMYRVDGQSTWDAALTPANGSNTLSPVVTLATRGA